MSEDKNYEKIDFKKASPRRKDLLKESNYEFDIIAADIDETLDPLLTPYENVKLLRIKKGRFCKKKNFMEIYY